MHSVLKDGSHITCDNFIIKSFASYLINSIFVSSLKTDTRFYTMMGSDKVKVSFFQTFIKHMQQTNPDFGKGCYVVTAREHKTAKYFFMRFKKFSLLFIIKLHPGFNNIFLIIRIYHLNNIIKLIRKKLNKKIPDIRFICKILSDLVYLIRLY